MFVFSKSPIYNMNVVLKETGLKADVLRAWERRYELPKPQRTPGGHRIYSEFDIEVVKWLRARQEEGLSISRAVELWKDMVKKGRDPVVDYLPTHAHLTDLSKTSDTQTEILLNNWIDACLNFDVYKADCALNQAFALYSVETVCTEILQKGINSIGDSWYRGNASVQQEHFASSLVIRHLETLISAASNPTRGYTVLLGCPPGEWHTIPVLLLSLFVLRKGFNIIYLGADIPIEMMKETVANIMPNLVVLTAQQLTTAATLKSAALSLQEQEVVLAYGGLIFNRIPKLGKHIPAYFLGESLGEAMHKIEQIIIDPHGLPSVDSARLAFLDLTRLFREGRSMVELVLLEELQADDLPIEFYNEATVYFGNGLSAALALGDPAFLEADLEWIKRLLTTHQVPTDKFIPFLAAYSHSVALRLGKDGTLITDWIDSYLANHESMHQ